MSNITLTTRDTVGVWTKILTYNKVSYSKSSEWNTWKFDYPEKINEEILKEAKALLKIEAEKIDRDEYKTLVVSRHKGLIEWLERRGMINETTEIVSHITDKSVLYNRTVIGNLPLSLACLTGRMLTIEMEVPQELRGKDITADEMDNCGAYVDEYKVSHCN